jgi:HD-GYP domain-containing protein (c-di-GMP phosphodiesterase class II)
MRLAVESFDTIERLETSPGATSLDVAEHLPIEEQRARRARPLGHRERWAAIVLGGGFLVAASAAAVLLPTHRSPAGLVYAGLIAAYALAFRLDFEVGTGSAVPTQLLLVPMLFTLPLRAVPLCVAAGILLAGAVDGARHALHLERTLVRVGNAWHSLGPVLVLAAAGERTPQLGAWPLYVAALAAQFVLDYAVVAARGRVSLGVSPREQLRSMTSVYVMDAALAPVGLAIAFAAAETHYAFLLALPLIGLLAVFSRERRTLIDYALELSHAYRGTAFLLGDVIEADDSYTGSHSRDVVDLTLAVADRLGLSKSERRDAEFVALLHDVGKVRIPNEIINKPGPLTPEERGIMNAHTIEGEKMLEQVGGLLGDVGRLVRSCHEHYDGSGYPDGLAGEEIPLVARIVCCCDAYHAMTSDRSYRRALPLETALEELHTNAGTQFDPDVVRVLVAVATAQAPSSARSGAVSSGW